MTTSPPRTVGQLTCSRRIESRPEDAKDRLNQRRLSRLGHGTDGQTAVPGEEAQVHRPFVRLNYSGADQTASARPGHILGQAMSSRT